MIQRFTREQIVMLQPYEQYFHTAINSAWSRYPGADALKKMHEALGLTTRLNTNCQACVLDLLRTCGNVYFASKQAVEITETQAEPVKVEVKTTRKRTSKKSTK